MNNRCVGQKLEKSGTRGRESSNGSGVQRNKRMMTLGKLGRQNGKAQRRGNGRHEIVPRRTPRSEEAQEEGVGGRLTLIAAPTAVRAGTFEGTTRRDRTTAAGWIAVTAPAEAVEEATGIPEEREVGDAGHRPTGGEQEEGEAVDDDERNHHGLLDEGGYAHEERGQEGVPASSCSARAAAARGRTGARPPWAFGRLGTAKYPAACACRGWGRRFPVINTSPGDTGRGRGRATIERACRGRRL
ncbi:unnamed protein product [Closterium sp. Naga37s-1]|nr:unnamed protein product [Closterium sp. Naga37s-1]